MRFLIIIEEFSGYYNKKCCVEKVQGQGFAARTGLKKLKKKLYD